MTIRLILIKVSFLLILACSPYKKFADKQVAIRSFVSEANEGLVYRASFAYREHNFSGIMAIKAHEADIHIVLMSELGPTIMNFTLTPDNLVVLDMIDLPKNKMLLKQLESDLRLMFLAGLHQHEKTKQIKSNGNTFKFRLVGEDQITVFTKSGSSQFVSAKRSGIVCDKVIVDYDYTDDGNVPSIITMKHSMVKIRMKLMLLQ